MLRPVHLPKQVKDRRIELGPWPHGLNLTTDHGLLTRTELRECLNWYVQRGGILESRPTIKRVTQEATSSAKSIYWLPDAEGTILIVADKTLYRITKNGQTIAITTSLESSDVGFLYYDGKVAILDSGYIKILDPSTWTVSLAYDAGTGTRGYVHYGISLKADTTAILRAGADVRVAAKITTPSWPEGYTIPPVRIEAMLGAVGNPTGNIYGRVRNVSNDTVIADVVLADAGELPTTGSALFIATFTNVTSRMDPNTQYYVSIEYSGGDTSNYVTVDVQTVISGGNLATYSTGWTSHNTRNPLIALSPGLPPKGRFGCAWASRPWIAGDPDNPGWLWFGNLSFLDWSTPSGGGYIGAVDDSRSSYKVGAVVSALGDLFVVGSPDTPYLVRITGGSPENYVQQVLYQHTGATSHMSAHVGNDVWVSDGISVWSVVGVQAYGDVRTVSTSDTVVNELIQTPAHTLAYHPTLGALLLLRDSPYMYVVNTRAMATDPNDQISIRYPWSTWAIYRHDFADTELWSWLPSQALGDGYYYLTKASGQSPDIDRPAAILADGVELTMCSNTDSLTDLTWFWGDVDSLGYDTIYLAQRRSPEIKFRRIHDAIIPISAANDNVTCYILGSDGHVYAFRDPSVSQQWSNLDLDTVQIAPIMKTGSLNIHAHSMLLRHVWPMAHARVSASGVLSIYQDTSVRTSDEDINVHTTSGDFTIEDIGHLPVSQATMLIVRDGTRLSRLTAHVYGTDVMIRVYLDTIHGSKAYMRSISAMIRPLRY